MVLTPGATKPLTFIDTGKGKDGMKWTGFAALGDSVYSAAYDSGEVLRVLDRLADL